jgi:hypothetical protein
VHRANCIADATQPLLPFARLAAGFRTDTNPNVVDYDVPSIIKYQVDWASTSCQDGPCGGFGVKRDPDCTGEIIASADWNETKDRLLKFIASVERRNDAVQTPVSTGHNQSSAPKAIKDVVELIRTRRNVQLDRGRCPQHGNGGVQFLIIRAACSDIGQQEYGFHCCDITKQRDGSFAAGAYRRVSTNSFTDSSETMS